MILGGGISETQLMLEEGWPNRDLEIGVCHTGASYKQLKAHGSGIGGAGALGGQGQRTPIESVQCRGKKTTYICNKHSKQKTGIAGEGWPNSSVRL